MHTVCVLIVCKLMEYMNESVLRTVCIYRWYHMKRCSVVKGTAASSMVCAGPQTVLCWQLPQRTDW